MARIITIQDLVEFFLEFVVGLAIEVRENGLDRIDAVVVLILVEAGLREAEVEQLQGGLEILQGGVAADAVLEIFDVRADAQGLAGEHLGHLGAGETGDTAVLLEQLQDLFFRTI